jgi:hypothetical protein
MKKLLLAAVAAISLAAPAHAAGDIVCSITDTLGNNLIYAFGNNTNTVGNTDRNFSGTMVETGFDKNGKSVFSRVGQRPIWIFNGGQNGFSLYSREAPGWAIAVRRGDVATLTYNGRFAGGGSCQTEADVGDQGE